MNEPAVVNMSIVVVSLPRVAYEKLQRLYAVTEQTAETRAAMGSLKRSGIGVTNEMLFLGALLANVADQI